MRIAKQFTVTTTMLQKANFMHTVIKKGIIVVSLLTAFLLLPALLFCNTTTYKDSIEQIKSRSYQLLGAKDYEGFLKIIDQGKKYALENRDSMNFRDFLIFEGEYYFMSGQSHKSIPLYRSVLSFMRLDNGEYINICNNLAQCYRDFDNLDSAIYYVDKAIELAPENGIQRLRSYSIYGDIYQTSGEYAKAIESIMNGLDGAEALALDSKEAIFKKDYLVAVATAELADMFLLIGDLTSANTYMRKAMSLSKKLGIKRTYHLSANQLGDIMLAQNEIDSALYIYQETYDELDKTTCSDEQHFFYYRNMFLGNLRKGAISEAENYLQNFEKYFNLLANDRISSTYYIVMAEYFLKKGNAQKCLRFLKEFDQDRNDKINIDYYRLRHLALHLSGNTAAAYTAQNEYYKVKDSLINIQNNQVIYNLEGKYNKAEQELAIAELDVANKEKTILLSRKNRTILFGGMGLITLAILGAMSFNLYRTKQKSAAELSAKNELISTALSEKELLLKEIHHRVKNNLQVISSLLSLQSDYIEDDTALSAIQEGRDRVKSMAIIHQNLYQEENLTGIQVKDYFEKLTKSLFSSYNIRTGAIDLTMNIDPINLDVDTVIPLGLIVNELITNALKYAFPNNQQGSIHIGLKEKNDQLILEVKDDGIGFDASSIKEDSNSFGYKIIQAFKDKLDAELTIESDNGTTVFFTIGEYKLAG